MLTGPWGIGKSFYIKNELIPFLETEENGKHQCIVVSLYGLSDTAEISKAIFFEAKLKLLNAKTSGGKAVRLVAKTLFKGITSYFGVDLRANEQDLNDLYSSIDLSGKLIVLEDVERSQIDILTLLGYVNNLVEQDGVKVLLVTNEEEIIKTEAVTNDKKEEEPFVIGLSGKEKAEAPQKNYTESTLCYLAVKEKTVSDTIVFEGNLRSAIMQLVNSFDNKILKSISNNNCAEDIADIMHMSRSYNLRSVLFACQKTSDIFDIVGNAKRYSDDFYKAVFYGITFFSLGMHAGMQKYWVGSEQLSTTLGSEAYPLFKFCYDYITTQKTDIDSIDSAADAFKRHMLYDKSSAYSDKDLSVLNNYDTMTETEVQTALDNVKSRLRDPDDIPYSDYGRLALIIVGLKNDLGFDIGEIKELLIANLKGKGDTVREEFIWSVPARFSEDARNEFSELRERMIEALKDSAIVISNFDYTPEQVSILETYVNNKRSFILESGRFAQYLDVPRLIEMIKKSSAEQIQRIRGVFLSLYLKHGNTRIYLSGDLEALETLKCKVAGIIGDKEFDRIQSLQCKWFVENLEDIIKEFRK